MCSWLLRLQLLVPWLLLLWCCCCQRVSSWTLHQHAVSSKKSLLATTTNDWRRRGGIVVVVRSSRVNIIQDNEEIEEEEEDEQEEEEVNHLITAGHYFKGIDENVGNAMIRAGMAWTTDWSQVAEALDKAAHAFWDTLSKKNLPAGLQTICRSVAQELEDISTIEGCSAVGPATSLPNWIAIHGYLESAAKAYQHSSEHQRIYNSLTNTSREIEHLIESI